MDVTVEDFVDVVFEEFKSRIPGLTKRKVELVIKNAFFCMSYNFARMRPMQLGEVYFYPNKRQCAFVRANKPVIGYKGYSLKQKAKKKLEDAENQYKKSLESAK